MNFTPKTARWANQYNSAPNLMRKIMLSAAMEKFADANMRKLNFTIIPDIEEFEGVKKHRVPYCYLHGQIETDCGFDIFGVKEMPPLSDGVYNATYKGKKCKMFIWNRGNSTMQAGLVVYVNDKESLAYAWEQYNKKSSVI